MKSWEISEEVLMNCTAYTYYIMLMAKCTCTWLHLPLQLLPNVLLLCFDSNKPGWFHVETSMHFLGLWFVNTAAAKIAIKWIQWWIGRSFHHVPIHITNYEICNI